MNIAPLMPHGPLAQLAPGLWQVTGTLPRNPLPRNMHLVALAEGGLLVHSAVALEPQAMQALDALGQVKVVVVPNPGHCRDAPFYRARYPQAKLVAPAQAVAQVSQRVALDGSAEELLPPLGVECLRVDGVKPMELAYRVALPQGRALLVCDLLFNLPHQPGFGGFMLRLLGSSGIFGITPIGRRLALQDAKQLAAWLRRMADDPSLKWVVMAHGDPVGEAVADRLRQAAARLD